MQRIKSKSIANPYSAEHPAPPSKFAGRYKQIKEFTRYLDETIAGNSKNIAVLGEWGIGKTSLLRKFKEIASTKGVLAPIIELGESVRSLLELFEIITKSLAFEVKGLSHIPLKVKELLEGLSLTVNYGPVGLASTRKEVSLDILRFRQDIKNIYKQGKRPFIIMLDNAEQLLEIKGSLMEIRNVFQRLQSMDEINCMVILAGRERLFSDIRSVYEPAVRFFWELGLAPFIIEETEEALRKPLSGAKIEFSQELIKKIHSLTQGHPYFIQLFGYNLFNLRKSDTVDIKDMENNYKEIFKRLFDSTFAILSSKEKEITLKLSSIPQEIFTNVDAKNYLRDVSALNRHLKNLSEREPSVLSKINRGQYRFYHPLFKEYLKTKV